MKIIILSILICVFSVNAYGKVERRDRDGAQLLKELRLVLSQYNDKPTLSADDVATVLNTYGYIEGYIHSLYTIQTLGKFEYVDFTDREDTQIHQYAMIIKSYLESHPEKLNQDASLLVLLALVENSPGNLGHQKAK